MPNDGALILGAVAYDPKVVTIWDGFTRYFNDHGLVFDYTLYSNYERQVEALVGGHIDVAWNSPLAWLQTRRIAAALGRRAEALCMRDTDRDLTSVILVRSESPIHEIEELRGRRVAVGAADSPQATLIPLGVLAARGIRPDQDVDVVRFDVLVGKHGDHIGGERDAVHALVRGEVDAACLLDSNVLAFTRDATIRPGATRVLARTPAFDHCNFTVVTEQPDPRFDRFRALLLGMSYADSRLRPLLDLEGLKAWMPGRTSGYRTLEDAIETFNTIGAFTDRVIAQCA